MANSPSPSDKWVGIGLGGVIVILIVLAMAFPESDEASQSGAPPPPTPTQDNRAANVAYTAWLQDLIGSIGTNLTELGGLFSRPIPGNDVWREKVRERPA